MKINLFRKKTKADDDPNGSQELYPAILIGQQKYVPLSLNRLTSILLSKFPLTDPQRRDWFRLFEALANVQRMHLMHHFDLMSQLYDPFDPDKTYFNETEDSVKASLDQDERLAICIRQIEETLNRANFEQIELDTVKHAVRTKNEYKIKYEPNFEVFDELRVYGRGFCLVERPKRNWRKGFKEEMKTHSAWNRLLVLVKFRNDVDLGPMIRKDRVYLRLFKDVAFRELEMHLPEQATRLRMPLADRFSIASPVVTGIPLFLFKIYSTAIVITNPVVLGTLALPLTKGWQSFTGFRNARLKHMHQMISNLFYLTLANNRQCLSRLLEMSWIQESMESILAYWVISHSQAEGKSINTQQLAETIEELIRRETQIDIQFQTHDAIDKLSRLNLLEFDGGNLSVPPIDQAIAELRTRWHSMSP